jgi:WD40 repeat protein
LGGPDSAGDVAIGRELLVLETPGSVGNVVWSPDGTLLASVGGFLDNVMRVWDATTGRELRTLEGHVDFVNGAAWSPDGTRLASGSDDGTLRVWGIAGE